MKSDKGDRTLCYTDNPIYSDRQQKMTLENLLLVTNRLVETEVFG